MNVSQTVRIPKGNSRSLDLSYWSGIFASGMTGLTQEYFTPFLLLMGGMVRHVGLLNALPNLCAAISQLKTAELTRWARSRRNLVVMATFCQGLTLLMMAGMACWGVNHPALLIALVILFTSFGAVMLPAWGSMLSDLVPEEHRGNYFGWRNKTLGFVVIGAMFFSGWILNLTRSTDVRWGFLVIFLLAFLFRLASWASLRNIEDPSPQPGPDEELSLVTFITRSRQDHFSRFVLFAAFMSFSVNLAAPFFAVFMLRDLSFDYLLYSIVTLTATLMVYFTIHRWGRHADRIGNLAVIRFTAPLIGVIPILWIFNRHPLFLLFAQLFSGFLWGGYNLSVSNYIYDAVPSEKRTRSIAYFNVFNGLALSAGSLLGGWLLPKLPPIFGYNILTLFLVSAVLRIVVIVWFSVRLKEVRPVHSIGNSDLFFSMLKIRPIPGVERKTIRF